MKYKIKIKKMSNPADKCPVQLREILVLSIVVLLGILSIFLNEDEDSSVGKLAELLRKGSVDPVEAEKVFSNNFEMDIKDNGRRNNIRKNKLKQACKKFKNHDDIDNTNSGAVLTTASNASNVNKLLSLANVTTDLLRPIKNRKIISCFSPKTGTTSWMAVFIAIKNGKKIDEIDSSMPHFYNTLDRYTQLIEKAIGIEDSESREVELGKLGEDIFGEQSVRILSSRHPLARLVSSWGDKFHFWSRNST